MTQVIQAQNPFMSQLSMGSNPMTKPSTSNISHHVVYYTINVGGQMSTICANIPMGTAVGALRHKNKRIRYDPYSLEDGRIKNIAARRRGRRKKGLTSSEKKRLKQKQKEVKKRKKEIADKKKRARELKKLKKKEEALERQERKQQSELEKLDREIRELEAAGDGNGMIGNSVSDDVLI